MILGMGFKKVRIDPFDDMRRMELEAVQTESAAPSKPPKHQPKAMRQLNESNNKKRDLVSDFMYSQERRASGRQTSEQTQAHIERMFKSLEQQRGKN